jgi:hypothetical protein
LDGACIEVKALTSSGWDLLLTVANSNFFTALAGAGFGAYGAHFIAERATRYRRRRDEVRAVNAAIGLTFSITNTICTLKDQHVRRMKEAFDLARQEIVEGQQKRREGLVPRNEPLSFKADFETLTLPRIPIAALETYIVERISVSGRPQIVVSALYQALDALGQLIAQRNQLIEDHQAKSPQDPSELVLSYFGFRGPEGRVDARYSGAMKGIYDLTDDCIFFSKLLSDDLQQHGQKLAKLFHFNQPKIQTNDFAGAVAKGLIPSSDHYKDWLALPKGSAELD